MYHFDHIPAGKKPEQLPNGEWTLVDLVESNPDDFKVILAEKDAMIKDLSGEVESLKLELQKYHKATNRK